MDGFFDVHALDGLDHAALAADLAPMGAAHDRDASFPFDALARLQQEGLLGLTVARRLGGGEAGLARCVALVGTVAQGCPATALVLAMQLIQQRVISVNPYWPAALRDQVGRDAVERGALINALRVEPALGSPARGGLPETIVRRVPGGWSLSGRKIYSTGAPGLSWFMVFARTDEPEPRVGMVLVPADAPGVTIVETWDHLGLRASGSHDVVFDGTPVPDTHLVDMRSPAGWSAKDPDQAAWSTMLVAALYTGVAIAARDWLVGFLRDRVPSNLGASLATLPRMQEAVGGIEALLTTNRRLTLSAATDFDQGRGPSTLECNLLKNVVAENAIAAVQQAVALTGNHGLSRANPLERHLRDVLCARIHTPQADAAQIAAGRAILGT
jgi:alkylation response protein AidB-like acyl-CoA dehydrogenase